MATMKHMTVLPVTAITFDNIVKVFEQFNKLNAKGENINIKNVERINDLLFNILPNEEYTELLTTIRFTKFVNYEYSNGTIGVKSILDVDRFLNIDNVGYFTKSEYSSIMSNNFNYSRKDVIIKEEDIKLLDGVIIVKVSKQVIKDIIAVMLTNTNELKDKSYVNKIIFRFYLNTITSRPNFVDDNNINKTLNNLTDIYLKM